MYEHYKANGGERGTVKSIHWKKSQEQHVYIVSCCVYVCLYVSMCLRLRKLFLFVLKKTF